MLLLIPSSGLLVNNSPALNEANKSINHSHYHQQVVTAVMELTPAGLNMFITASTDSLFIPCSHPGGAKL